MKDILSTEIGVKHVLLGNEAIVRGAVEAGVGFVSTYPGTPSSEIGNILFQIAKDIGMYFEFSVNEKVALEGGAAAAASKVRSLVSMKHVGLNVAADAFMSLAYVGTRAGLVIISADDPSLHASQNEQDNRYYSQLGNLPMLEPSTAQEAKDMTIKGFDISEELESPVLLRTTTRVNHANGVVEYGPRQEIKSKGHFERNIPRFVVVPSFMRKRRLMLTKNIERARGISEKSEFNYIAKKDGIFGVITSGAAFNYVMDVVEELNLDAAVLKLGMTNPMPENMISKFMKDKEFIVTVEELSPFLEDHINRIAKQNDITIPIYGKRTKHFPFEFEYNPDVVKKGLGGILNLDTTTKDSKTNLSLPSRPPPLCPGCSHRSIYYAVKKALGKKDVIYATDIGCYTLGYQAPFETTDYHLCMGSSIGTGNGFSQVTDQTVISFIGDSTFFHAGIPALINAVYNNHKVVIIIMDNRTTAMTGHQPHPGTGLTGMKSQGPGISIENIVKGCGVAFVRVVDPNNISRMIETVKECIDFDGVSVIIAKRPCILMEVKKKSRELKTHTINQETCNRCYVCINQFACPAFYKDEDGAVFINETLCNGCGVCAQVCPMGTIKSKEARR